MMKFRVLDQGQKKKAFTLIELLIVIAILGVLISLGTPMVLGMIGASRLTAAGDQMVGLLTSAQQIASAEGRPVEVRFYEHADSTGVVAYRTALLLSYYEAGEVNPDRSAAATERVLDSSINIVRNEKLLLPDNIVIASLDTGSSILSVPAPTEDQESKTYLLNRAGKKEYTFPAASAEYRSFIFRSRGTSLPVTAGTKWFLTLLSADDEAKGTPMSDVKNFYCVQIDPANGQITAYRP